MISETPSLRCIYSVAFCYLWTHNLQEVAYSTLGVYKWNQLDTSLWELQTHKGISFWIQDRLALGTYGHLNVFDFVQNVKSMYIHLFPREFTEEEE